MFRTIRARMITVMVISISLLLTASVVTVYIHEKNHLFEMALESSLKQSELFADSVGMKLHEIVLMISLAAEDDQVEQLDRSAIGRELMSLRDREEILFEEAYFVDALGRVRYNGKDIDLSDTVLFEELRATTEAVYSSYDIRGYEAVSINSIGVPVINSGGKFVGAIVVQLNLPAMEMTLQDIKLKDSSYGWIYDADGLLITHPRDDYAMYLYVHDVEEAGFPGFDAIAEGVQEGRINYGRYMDDNIGESKIVTFSSIENSPDWTLAITTLEREIFAQANDLLKGLAGVSLIFFGLYIIVIAVVINTIMKPIVSFTEAVKTSQYNGFSIIDMGRRRDEIGDLINSYNDMALEINAYTKNLEEVVDQRTDELNQLNELLNERNDYLSNVNEQLFRSATTDILTGVMNRYHFDKVMKEVKVRVADGVVKPYGVLFMDLNNFKYYNDTFGHEIGDELLKTCSNLMESNLRSGDVLARYGGDEFVALIKDGDLHNLKKIAEELEEVIDSMDGAVKEVAMWLKKPAGRIIIPVHKKLGLSVGYGIIDEGTESVEKVVQYADEQMYRRKRLKKSLYQQADSKPAVS